MSIFPISLLAPDYLSLQSFPDKTNTLVCLVFRMLCNALMSQELQTSIDRNTYWNHTGH